MTVRDLKPGDEFRLYAGEVSMVLIDPQCAVLRARPGVFYGVSKKDGFIHLLPEELVVELVETDLARHPDAHLAPR